VAEYYQAADARSFYVVPAGQRKFPKTRMELLASNAPIPGAPQVIANPWINYERDWDWIESQDGICINYAGCLHREEVDRREDEGVARAIGFVATLLDKETPVPITVAMIRQIHSELMGDIYPFAGEWRTVSLHKGDGPTKWPLPITGIAPRMDEFARDVLSRSPLISDDNPTVYAYISEAMNELLAIHPFREGNGRIAFILANLILMQNDLLPLDVYDARHHQDPYYAACEAGRLNKDYAPLANLIENWEAEALQAWEDSHGQ
jgi:cell filamentation protein